MSRFSLGIAARITTLIALCSSSAIASPVVIERIEASVNSSLILLSDVTTFRKNRELRAQIDQLFQESPLASKGDAVSDGDIVQYLIDERLILQEFPITDTEVEKAISSIQIEQKYDRET